MGKAERPPQLLAITPNSELEFKGDPKEVNTTQIELRNDTQNKIGFKVMTNAPQLLFVRPACEVIMPNSRSSINVMLQPHQHESDGLKQHKLLIQSIIVQPEDSHESIDKLFTNNANNTHLVMETRLNCTFKELYTSEMVFPLSSEPADHHHVGDGRANTEATAKKNEEHTAAPPLNVTMVAILLAALAAILSWVVYFKYFDNNNTDDGGDDENLAEAVLAGEND